jgi:hypothetical protein
MNVKLIGFLLLIFGVPLLFVNWLSIIVVLIGIFIVTTRYGLKIDSENKKYQDYLQIAGLKTGEEKEYEQIEKLFITAGKKTTKMQLRGHASYLNQLEYNGFIKFSEDDKVHLISSKDKKVVMGLLKLFSDELAINIDDLSE